MTIKYKLALALISNFIASTSLLAADAMDKVSI